MVWKQRTKGVCEREMTFSRGNNFGLESTLEGLKKALTLSLKEVAETTLKSI